jgi:hypothetical protein
MTKIKQDPIAGAFAFFPSICEQLNIFNTMTCFQCWYFFLQEKKPYHMIKVTMVAINITVKRCVCAQTEIPGHFTNLVITGLKLNVILLTDMKIRGVLFKCFCMLAETHFPKHIHTNPDCALLHCLSRY